MNRMIQESSSSAVKLGRGGLGVACFKPPSRIDSVKGGREGGREGDLIAGASFREVAIEQLRFLVPLSPSLGFVQRQDSELKQ